MARRELRWRHAGHQDARPYRGALGDVARGDPHGDHHPWPERIRPRVSYAMFFMDFSRPSRGWQPARADDRPIDGIDQSDLLLGKNDSGAREHLLTFVGSDLVAVRWKQFRAYFADVAPGRSGGGGAILMGGVGASAAPMNGYPKVFNIESDPQEEQNIGEMYNWVLGPLLKVVEEYKTSVEQSPNPPAANMTRF